MIATGTIGAPLSSASRPIPRRGLDESSPVRERPPSAYMAITSPRSRIVTAVVKASSSAKPRRTGKTPPGE